MLLCNDCETSRSEISVISAMAIFWLATYKCMYVCLYWDSHWKKVFFFSSLNDASESFNFISA